jgi:phosphatidylserine/phosphatidylglycerophosphate/cardiolipin synthase-like enzyme
LALAFAACGGGSGADEASDDSDLTSGKIELFFTNPLPDLIARGEVNAADVAGLDTSVVGSGPAPDKRLVQLIDSAKGKSCSVLVADYDFDLQDVADAMVRAKQRGCDVRMVTDGDTVDHANPSTDPSQRYGRQDFKPEYEKPLKAILDAGIPVHDDGTRGAIMHNKFVVINGKVVWGGSWNMSVADLSYWNNAAVLPSPTLAARYTTNFEFLFKEFSPALSPLPHTQRVVGDLPADHVLTIGGRPVEVFFPHTDKAAARVAEIVSGATESVHLMAFQFTAGPIADALLDRASKGLEIRGVFENNGACQGVYPQLAATKGNVTVSRWAFGHIQGLRNFLHHKVFIVDQKTVVFGSFNFTASAEDSNDENLIVVTDPAIAKTFEQEYQLIEKVIGKTKQAPACGG